MRLSRVKIGFVAIVGVLAVLTALPTAALAVDARITTDALYNQANSYPNGATVGDGQCFDFGYQVFKAVAQSVGSSALIGNAGDGTQADGGYGYYGCYLHAGGVEVSQDEARRGDYIQIYDSVDPWRDAPTVSGGYSVHTAIIQDNLGGGVFNVIDENYTPLTVSRHQFSPAKHIASCGGLPWKVAYWRLGTAPDSTPPSTPVVQAGDAGSDAVQASWSSADPGSGIAEYQYCVGNSPGAANACSWTSVGTATSAAVTGLASDSENFFVSVRARNAANVWSSVGTSEALGPLAPPFGSAVDSPVMTSDQPNPTSMYRPLVAPTNYNLVAAGTTTAARSFTTKTAGLVAVRYFYTLSGNTSVHALVDGLELSSRNVVNDGAGGHTRTDYVFLRTGKHKLSFWVTGGSAYVNGTSVGIDTR